MMTFTVSSFAFATPASADFELCNNSSKNIIYVSYAYDSRSLASRGEDTTKMPGHTVRGWVHLRRGDCSTLVVGDLRHINSVYAYGEAFRNGRRVSEWSSSSDERYFCVHDRDRFRLNYVTYLPRPFDCANGFSSRGFHRYRTSNQRHMTRSFVD